MSNKSLIVLIDETINVTLADIQQLKSNVSAFAKAGMKQYARFATESIKISQEQLKLLAEERKLFSELAESESELTDLMPE